MASAVVELSDSSFEREVIQSEKPVLVDFWAPWCGPCRMLLPTIEKLAREYAGRIKVAKLNTDEHNDTPSRFGINAIPTLIIFKNGKIAERLTGIKSIDELRTAIATVLES